MKTACTPMTAWIACLLVGALASTAQAANGTWTNIISGGLWSSVDNWISGIVGDGSTSTADFSTLNITADNTVHLNTARTLQRVIFGDTETTTAAGWTLDNNGTPANTLTLASSLASITVNTLGSGKSANISAVMAGSLAWTKTGTGQLTLSGLNTYTGQTGLRAGTLSLDYTAGNNIVNPASVLSLGSLLANIATSYTLTLNGAAGTANTQAFAGSGANSLTPGMGHIALVPGASGGTMALQLGISTRSTVLSFTSGSGLEFNLPSGATLYVAAPNYNSIMSPLCTVSTTGVGQANTWAVSGSPASQSVSCTAPNTLTVTAGTAPAVGQQINFTVIPFSSTLAVSQVYYVESSSSPNFTISTSRGGSAATVGTSITNGTMFTEGVVSGLATYSSSYTATNLNLNVGTGGTLTANPNSLRFNNNSAATVTIADGTSRSIAYGGILVTPAVGANVSKITGGVLQGQGRRDLQIIQNNPAGVLQIDSYIDGLNGGLMVTKQGVGTLLLTKGGCYPNATVVNEGKLIVSGDYVAPVTRTATSTTGSAILTGMTDTSGIFIGEEVAPLTTYLTGNNSWIVIAITPNTSVTLGLSSGIATSPAGTAFTFRGAGGLGTATTVPVSIAPDATVQIGNAGTTGSLFLGQPVFNNGTLAFNRTDTGLSFGNIVSGSGAVVNSGSGTVTLTGTNTYTGGTTANAGMLAISGSGTFGTNSGPLTAAGGILDLGGNALSAGAVTSTNNGTIQNGTLTGTSYALQSGTISAALAGSAPVTKTTSGTLTLSGANTYSGITEVTAGTVRINGNSAGVVSAMNVSPNARIGGNGSYGGNITLASGAGLSYDITLANNTLICGGQLSFSNLNFSDCAFTVSPEYPPYGKIILIQAASLGTATFGNPAGTLGLKDARLSVEGAKLILTFSLPGTMIRIL